VRARTLAVTSVATAITGALALSAFRLDARADRERGSALFTAPVALLPRAERLLPPPEETAAHDIGAAERVLRIADDVEAVFGNVTDVAPSRSADTVYVLDGMNATVSAFDRAGRLLFRFGGRGDGPGEFRGPVQLLVLPWSGEVAVWDGERQRLTLHTPAGRPVRVDDPDAERRTTSRTVQRIAAYDDGYVVQVHADPLRMKPGRQRGALIKLDSALHTTDTLFHFAIADVRASHAEWENGSSATTWLHPPIFSPAPSWDVLSDGTVLFAPGGPAEAYRVAPDGAVTRIRWPAAPRRITRADRLRRLAGERDRGLVASRTTPLVVLEPLNRRFFAAAAPSVTGVLAGPGGSLWTRGFDTRDGWEGFARTWARAGTSGRRLPGVRFPERFTPLRIHGGLVYGVREDASNAQFIEVYRP
jgi:hypothetical protein